MRKRVTLRWIGYSSKIQEPACHSYTQWERCTNEEAEVYVHFLDLFVTVQVLDLNACCSIAWNSAKTTDILVSGSEVKKPRVTKEEKTILCKTDNFAPLVVPGIFYEFWVQFVVNIDIAGFVFNKSSSRAKWRTSSTSVVRITLGNL